jgi:hypothetical protein
VQTVAHLTDDMIADLNIPSLPDTIPQRLETAVVARVEAFLYQLKTAEKERYVRPLEVRILRDAHRAVLTACELDIKDAHVYYAKFRHLAEALGYERSEVGFSRIVVDE